MFLGTNVDVTEALKIAASAGNLTRANALVRSPNLSFPHPGFVICIHIPRLITLCDHPAKQNRFAIDLLTKGRECFQKFDCIFA